ncbi:MAG: Gfo/Idh/MocA family oxidoreductase [Planctomycetes bacterium]|nr:Gfo/Idh/MocA family oxidoreductase [Planctomycetota bacterium]
MEQLRKLARPGISRRRFLEGSAAALVVPLIAPAARARPRAADPDVLKVGLIGCGGRGTGAAAQALSAEAGTVILTAAGDLFRERVDASLANLAAHFGPEVAERVQVDEEHRFAGFDAYQQVIDSGVDVVLLATPPWFRPAHLSAAVAAGKHVFCEKPMAVDAPGVRAVLAAVAEAERKRLALVSGFCWRYSARHREFYARLRDGAIGAVRAVYSTYNTSPLGTHTRRPEWSEIEFQLRNWQHMIWLSGDHLVEQAVHSIDKQSWLLGDRPPLTVTAVGGRQARSGEESGNVYDHFSATFDYGDGVKAFHMCRQIANCSNDNSDYILGEKGNATILGWSNLAITGPNAWVPEGEGNDMYQQEHDELFASIRAGTPRNDGSWMATSVLLAIMARMAAYTGQTITWEQALNSQQKLGPETLAWGDVPLDPVPVPGQTRFF